MADRESEQLDWGVAMLPLPGEVRCGDLHLVKLSPVGPLVAVVDGLGHGDEAAEAAKVAIATLAANTHLPLTTLFSVCHQALLRTRGVVMSVASFSAGESTMTWLSVGNVEGAVFRTGQPGKGDAPQAEPFRETLTLRSGVVGYRLPTLRPATLALRPGDTVILATDGIRSDFMEGLRLDEPPGEIAKGILARSARGTDDALALVARWNG